MTSQLPAPAAMPSLPPTVLSPRRDGLTASGSETKQSLSPLSYFHENLLSQQIKAGGHPRGVLWLGI